ILDCSMFCCYIPVLSLIHI
ncbi:hypothetical protein A5795_002649, partial [Enterococcus faecalis]